jgi:hypothetical protein
MKTKRQSNPMCKRTSYLLWMVIVFLCSGIYGVAQAQSFGTPTRFEAENGFNLNVTTSSANAGYSGSGYVTGMNNGNSETKFYKGADPSYPLTKLDIRYANGTGANVTNLELVIGSNHKVQDLVFPATANWTTWGIITVVFTHDPSWGGDMRIVSHASVATSVNIDYTEVSVSNGTLTQVATPTFSPAAGTYTSTQSVTLSTATSGATIYYTTDGSTPTISSAVYTSPISVASTKTIKAFSKATGMLNSSVASATYTINTPSVATPTFSPAAGTYSSTQSVSISTTTSGASIYYTTDNSTPTPASSLYTGAISVATTRTVKAIGVKSGMSNSSLASALYTINSPPPVPESFSQTAPSSGATNVSTTPAFSWGGSSNATSYTLVVKTNMSLSNPIINQSAISSTSYTSGTALAYSTAYYWKVTAVNATGTQVATNAGLAFTTAQAASAQAGVIREIWTGISGTDVASLTSNSNYPSNPNSSSVITSFDAQEFGDNYGQRIRGYLAPTVSGSYQFWIASDDGSELWLSTNDNPANKVKIASVSGWTNPYVYTKYSSQTSASITLTAGNYYYIEALQKEQCGGDHLTVAWQVPGGSQSIITSANLVTSPSASIVAMPTFSPAGGTYSSAQSVVISSATTGSTIYYTTDGTTPTTASAVYSSAISVASSQTLKALATKSGLVNSSVGTAAYTITLPPPAPGAFTQTAPAGGATGVSRTPAFSWAASSNAASYTLVVSTSSALTSPAINQTGITGTSYTPSAQLAASTVYYWRVTAVNATASTVATNAGLSFTTAAGTPPVPSQAGVIREVWSNVAGISISDLTSNANYPNSPTTSTVISTIDPPRDLFDNYGQRIKGYLAPTVTGSYKFWIASDDDSELWLSTTSDPDNKVKIASFTGWTYPETYNQSGTQASANISLTAGNYYYIEALHKEANGGDHVTVAWQVPGGSRVTIPNANLVTAPPVPLPAPGAFNQTAPAGGTTGVALNPTLTWGASSDAASYTVVVANNSSFTSPVVNQAGITGTSYSIGGGLSGTTTYYWRVTAVNVSGTRAATNAGLSFTTLTPPAPSAFTQTAPASGATGVSTYPAFSWAAATNASSYTLVVSTSSSYTSPIINQSGLTSTSYTVPNPFATNVVYYWKVTATNSTGSTVATNAGISFTTGTTSGTVYYVSTSGSNTTGNGTSGSPWRTLAYAASQVTPGTGNKTISLGAGTFVETAMTYLPLGVNIVGAGESNTIITANAAFPIPSDVSENLYPLYADGSLIQLKSPIYINNARYGSPAEMVAPTNGSQTLSGFTMDGNGKKVKAGVWVENRSNVTMHHVTFKSFKQSGSVFSRGDMWWYEPIPAGKWMENTTIYNCTFINSGSTNGGEQVGNLCLGGLDGADIYNITITDPNGQGIKFAHVGHFRNTKIHDCTVTVGESDPTWGEKMAIELWNLSYGNELYNFNCNTWMSLVNHVQFNDYQPTIAHPSNLKVRNCRIVDQDGSSGKEAIECALSGVEISECYIQDKGFGIAIWGGAGWGGSIAIHDINIHNNIIANVNRSVQYGFGNSAGVFIPDAANTIKINNNVFDNLGNSLQLDAGSSLTVKNNVFQNSGGDDVQGGSSITFTNNLRYHTDPQNQNWKVSTSVNSTNIKGNPGFKKTGSRWDTYYQPSSSASLIVDAGVNIGLPYFGSAPDIGRWEFGLKSFSVISEVVEETSNDDVISTYPNPTTGLVKISSNPEFKVSSVQVLNLQGKAILTKLADKFNNVSVDLSQQANDIYIFKIKHSRGVTTKKVVLMK